MPCAAPSRRTRPLCGLALRRRRRGGDAPTSPTSAAGRGALRRRHHGLRRDARARSRSRPRNLHGERRDDFFVGNAFFNRNWVTAPASVAGLRRPRPALQRARCSGCHFKDGRGAPPTSPTRRFSRCSLRLELPGAATHGGAARRADLRRPASSRRRSSASRRRAARASRTRRRRARSPTARRTRCAGRRTRSTSSRYGPLAPDDDDLAARRAGRSSASACSRPCPRTTIVALADPDDARRRRHLGPAEPRLGRRSAERSRSAASAGRRTSRALAQQTAGAFLGDIGITLVAVPERELHRRRRPSAPPRRPAASPSSTRRARSTTSTYYTQHARRAGAARRRRRRRAARQARCSTHAGCAELPRRRRYETGELDGLPGAVGPDDPPVHRSAAARHGRRTSPTVAPTSRRPAREWRTPPLWGIGLVADGQPAHAPPARRPRARLRRGDPLARRRSGTRRASVPRDAAGRSRRAARVPGVAVMRSRPRGACVLWRRGRRSAPLRSAPASSRVLATGRPRRIGGRSLADLAADVHRADLRGRRRRGPLRSRPRGCAAATRRTRPALAAAHAGVAQTRARLERSDAFRFGPADDLGSRAASSTGRRRRRDDRGVVGRHRRARRRRRRRARRQPAQGFLALEYLLFDPAGDERRSSRRSRRADRRAPARFGAPARRRSADKLRRSCATRWARTGRLRRRAGRGRARQPGLPARPEQGVDAIVNAARLQAEVVLTTPSSRKPLGIDRRRRRRTRSRRVAAQRRLARRHRRRARRHRDASTTGTPRRRRGPAARRRGREFRPTRTTQLRADLAAALAAAAAIPPPLRMAVRRNPTRRRGARGVAR